MSLCEKKTECSHCATLLCIKHTTKHTPTKPQNNKFVQTRISVSSNSQIKWRMPHKQEPNPNVFGNGMLKACSYTCRLCHIHLCNDCTITERGTGRIGHYRSLLSKDKHCDNAVDSF